MLDTLFEYIEKFRYLNYESLLATNFLIIVGSVFVAAILLKLLLYINRLLRLYVFCQYLCRTDYIKRYGKWALITGATDGIGLELARELTNRGHSIILLGRNEKKLARCKQLIEADFIDKSPTTNSQQVICVKIDLSSSSLDDYERVAQEIDPDKRDIGIVINNAGIVGDIVARYHRHPETSMIYMLNVNCLATALITRMVLSGMLARRRGLILNISSVYGAEYFTGTNSSLYGPTKAFVSHFSRQLREEYKGYPIDIIDSPCGFLHGGVFLQHYTGNWLHKLMATPNSYAKCLVNCLSSRMGSLPGHILNENQIFWFKYYKFLGIDRPMQNMYQKMSVEKDNLTPKAERNKKPQQQQQPQQQRDIEAQNVRQ